MYNWSGNIKYSTDNVYYPSSTEEVQQLVKQSGKLKVLGSRHCFNTIADSREQFISLAKMNSILSLDVNAKTVTVEGGIKYGELCPWLHDNGFALHNLASLPHISVAGACATATHGSGIKNSNLATAVSAMEIITADGSIMNLSRNDGELFNAAVVHLGAIGVITKITLDIQPAFVMRQHVYERMPLSQLRENFDAIVAAGYSVSLFTDWQTEYINEVWVKARIDDAVQQKEEADFFGATLATQHLHPIAEVPAENCTEQMGIPGPWYERLPHFKMGFTPSSGKELQSEYFVPRQHAVEAIAAIARLGSKIAPHLFISEIRTIDADTFWMSPCYRQSCVALHFTWKPEWQAVKQLLPVIEKELAPFHVKPHWGKLFTLPATVLASRFEKLPAFASWVAEIDPKGKFRNEFLANSLTT